MPVSQLDSREIIVFGGESGSVLRDQHWYTSVAWWMARRQSCLGLLQRLKTYTHLVGTIVFILRLETRNPFQIMGDIPHWSAAQDVISQCPFSSDVRDHYMCDH